MALSPALRKRLPLFAAGLVVIALVIGGFFWWQGKQRWEATDNAFVQADTTLVSPQINGYVTEVLVTDNQRVEPGQILVPPRRFRRQGSTGPGRGQSGRPDRRPSAMSTPGRCRNRR